MAIVEESKELKGKHYHRRWEQRQKRKKFTIEVGEQGFEKNTIERRAKNWRENITIEDENRDRRENNLL